MKRANPVTDVNEIPDLDQFHARMRARDRSRIASGEATPQQIQDENSLLRKPSGWSLPVLTD